MLQPLDLGIIKNFKVYYRRSMLEEILLTLEKDLTAIPSFTVGQAITMMVKAWRQVTPITIRNCWLKALPSLKQHKDFDVAIVDNMSADDEHWILADPEMSTTWEIVIGSLASDGSAAANLEDFIQVDDDVDICSEYEVTEKATENTPEMDPSAGADVIEVEDVEDVTVPTLLEALQCLQQLETFSCYDGLAEELGKHTDKIRSCLTKRMVNKNTKQSLLTDFFNPLGSRGQ
jgi:hypothetical protein